MTLRDFSIPAFYKPKFEEIFFKVKLATSILIPIG
jgi:hypothetical protein